MTVDWSPGESLKNTSRARVIVHLSRCNMSHPGQVSDVKVPYLDLKASWFIY